MRWQMFGLQKGSRVKVASSGTYSGTGDQNYEIEITTAGITGVAVATWKSYTSAGQLLTGTVTLTSGASAAFGALGLYLTFTWTGMLKLGQRWVVEAFDTPNIFGPAIPVDTQAIFPPVPVLVDVDGNLCTAPGAATAARIIRNTLTVPPATPVSNGDFAAATNWISTNWTVAGNKATHTAGNTSALSQDISQKVGWICSVTFTVSGLTPAAGTVTMSLGGRIGTVRSTDGTYTEVLAALNSAASGLAFTPTTGFDGAITAVSDEAYLPVTLVAAHGLDIKNLDSSRTLYYRLSSAGDYDQVGAYGTELIRPPAGMLKIGLTVLHLYNDGTWGQLSSCVLKAWEEA